MELENYFGKDVRLIDTDGDVFYGHVRVYTKAIDTEDELCDEIAVQIGDDLIEFSEKDIKKIEITAK